MEDEFRGALEMITREIPRGRVATCGAIARALGDIRAARAVAAWLSEHPDSRGAHRVVRADGRPILLTAMNRLRQEGISSRARIPRTRFVDDLPRVGILRRLRQSQRRMAERVVERDSFPDNPALGGVDVAYHAGRAFAAAVRCDAEGFDVIESAVTELPVDFPYIPGYLAFREFPGVAAALGRLRKVPDILLVDGHGRLHPALFGLACFIGVRLNLCTIGVAKHPLVGRPARRTEAQEEAIPLVYAGRARGYAWTPPGGAKAIYISVGHRISLRTALETVRRSTRDRYPQPLVEADRLSKETKRESKEGEGLSQSPDGDRATRESAGLISSFSCPSSS